MVDTTKRLATYNKRERDRARARERERERERETGEARGAGAGSMGVTKGSAEAFLVSEYLSAPRTPDVAWAVGAVWDVSLSVAVSRPCCAASCPSGFLGGTLSSMCDGVAREFARSDASFDACALG